MKCQQCKTVGEEKDFIVLCKKCFWKEYHKNIGVELKYKE